MDFGKAFSFVFDDKDWFKKLLIPALYSIIPIAGQIFIVGWTFRIAKQLIKGEPVVLPEVNFGDDFMFGLKVLAVLLIYAAVIALIAWIPVVGQILAIVAGAIWIGPMLVVFLAHDEDFGAAFNFKGIWDVFMAAPTDFILAYLGALLASVIASLGVIACVVGIFMTSAYAGLVSAHLYGQAYISATHKAG